MPTPSTTFGSVTTICETSSDDSAPESNSPTEAFGFAFTDFDNCARCAFGIPSMPFAKRPRPASETFPSKRSATSCADSATFKSTAPSSTSFFKPCRSRGYFTYCRTSWYGMPVESCTALALPYLLYRKVMPSISSGPDNDLVQTRVRLFRPSAEAALREA